jgi:UDP-N-acetyl-D-glucosamine dehydrogenase
MRAGVDFHLAFSPEREDPANDQSKVKSIPKVVGGYTPACLERALALYSRAIDTLVPVSSCRVAEATKLLENIFRSVNIALVNELKVVYEAMGIDIWEVITAAKTKPFGFMPFYPGPGLGGHCIPIDPFYLSCKARASGFEARFIELAGHVNGHMPEHAVDLVSQSLNRIGKAVRGAKVLVLGVAYKADIDDTRESPSLDIMQTLHDRGANIEYSDPFVPTLSFLDRKLKSVTLTPARIRRYDCVVIATAHAAFRYGDVVRYAKGIVDTRNALRGRQSKKIIRL